MWWLDPVTCRLRQDGRSVRRTCGVLRRGHPAIQYHELDADWRPLSFAPRPEPPGSAATAAFSPTALDPQSVRADPDGGHPCDESRRYRWDSKAAHRARHGRTSSRLTLSRSLPRVPWSECRDDSAPPSTVERNRVPDSGLAENRLPAIFAVAEGWRERLQSEVEAGVSLAALDRASKSRGDRLVGSRSDGSSHFGQARRRIDPVVRRAMDGTTSLANRDFGRVCARTAGMWFSPVPRIMQMKPQARAISPF
jgi:hypothetical protein